MNTSRLAASCGLHDGRPAAIAGFTALGSVFDYPAILEVPTAEILAAVPGSTRAPSPAGSSCSSSAPRCSRRPASCSGRIAGGTLGRWIAGIGIAAATVQVIGLSRWVLLVPGVSDDATDAGQGRRRAARPSSCCTRGWAR